MSPLLALDAPTPPPASSVNLEVPIGTLLHTSSLAEYIGALFRYGLGIIGLIATVMIVIAGVQWLLAAGDSGKITEAKNRITNAVIGLILALTTTVLLNTINPELLKLRELKVPRIESQAIDLARRCPSGTNNCPCRGEKDAPNTCDQNLRCVEAAFVFGSVDDIVLAEAAGGAIGGRVGSGLNWIGFGFPIGTLVGTSAGMVSGLAFSVGESKLRCTNGGDGSPCDDNEDCTSGFCDDNYYHVCYRPPVANGGLCESNSDCTSGDCVAAPVDRDIGSVLEGRPSYCHGESDIRGACYTNGDCQSGLRCLRTEAGSGVCARGGGGAADPIQETDPCVLIGTNQIQPPACNGSSNADFTCLYCPGTGARYWTPLTDESDPQHARVGECKPKTGVRSTPCAR